MDPKFHHFQLLCAWSEDWVSDSGYKILYVTHINLNFRCFSNYYSIISIEIVISFLLAERIHYFNALFIEKLAL